MAQGYKKTTKLEKIEKQAWKEFNWNNRKIGCQLLDNLNARWEKEVIKITGKAPEYGEVIFLPEGEQYSYTFIDCLA